jgi:DNA polymerase III alpha subunit (gram-positive type)
METSERFVKMSPRRNLIASSIHGGWPVSRVVRELPEVSAVSPQTGSYVELHCHSAFSLREGASLPEELVQLARALGYQALALTDHDSLAGAMKFAQAARAEKLQAIIGAEITLTDDSHLTLLCETPRG